jgi:hypothetical protein
MSILRKAMSAITLTDLDELVRVSARETGELEFKGALPFQPTKGQPETADRWIEKGDRIGDHARNEVLAEIVAFANADGGTLVLGMHETKDEPRRAERLEPLPKCEELAKRFFDAAEDVIEPRLPGIVVHAVPAADDGSGYVLMRVGKSLVGPHRLTTTREFYIRRGERSSRMSVREITDRTLALARTGDRVESVFSERHEAAGRIYRTLIKNAAGKPADGVMPLIVRVTAVPTMPQIIPNVTHRADLWWSGSEFTATADGNNYPCPYPARNFNQNPNVRLRSLVVDADTKSGGTARLIRSDGLVEFSLVHPKREASYGTDSRVYLGWIIGLVAGVVSQVNHVRDRLAWDAVEYGLEIQIWGTDPLGVHWNDHTYDGGYQFKADLPLTLPRYSLAPGENEDEIVTTIVRDIFNATGTRSEIVFKLRWDELK